MKLWKWDIRSIKKEDEFEAHRLGEILETLSAAIEDTITLMECVDVNDDSLITKVYYMANSIKTFIIMYEENKFSRPFTTINLIQTMEQANNKMCAFQQMLIRYKTVNTKIVPHLQEKMFELYDDNILDTDMGIHNTIVQLEKHIRFQANLITRDLIALKVAIQYDVFRIASGVDIVRSHYELKKRYPRGKAKFHVDIMHDRPISKEG